MRSSQAHLIFTSERSPLELRNLRRHFARLCAAAAVPPVRLYPLRHTCIALLLAGGENVKAVASSVGHAPPPMTLNVYAHALPDTGAKLAATMDRLLAVGRRAIPNRVRRGDWGRLPGRGWSRYICPRLGRHTPQSHTSV